MLKEVTLTTEELAIIRMLVDKHKNEMVKRVEDIGVVLDNDYRLPNEKEKLVIEEYNTVKDLSSKLFHTALHY